MIFNMVGAGNAGEIYKFYNLSGDITTEGDSLSIPDVDLPSGEMNGFCLFRSEPQAGAVTLSNGEYLYGFYTSENPASRALNAYYDSANNWIVTAHVNLEYHYNYDSATKTFNAYKRTNFIFKSGNYALIIW